VGTASWTERTGGRLSAAERRSLVAPVVRVHAAHLGGRVALALGVAPRGAARVRPEHLLAPRTMLARVVEAHAAARLGPVLLHHSYRTYGFAVALGIEQRIEVDRELLYAAALLHDVGLGGTNGGADFTSAGARLAAQIADDVGLGRAARDEIRSAITLHHSPDVSPADGPVAYLLSAGAALDVVGLRAWRVPIDVRRVVLDAHPRGDCKRELRAALRVEADEVPAGRVRFLRRWAAFDLAIRLAPFPT
jgi:hypothetical protein